MTVAPPQTVLGPVFWKKVLSVAGLYLLVQWVMLSTTGTGWSKYVVLTVPEDFQYWDAGIYAQLAIAPNCTAFYPLWPGLIRLLGHPETLTQALRLAIGGSALLYLGSLPLALLTFEKIIQQRGLALLAFFLYALGPNAIFQTIGYTESLFSVLSLGLLLTLAIIEDCPSLRGIQAVGLYGLLLGLTILMSLTRPMMVPSLGAIALILCLTVGVQFRHFHALSRPTLRRALRVPQAFGLAGVMGLGSLAGYAIYGHDCWQTLGNFWAPFHAQVEWGRSLAWRPGLLLLPRSLLIDLHGVYLPALLLVAVAGLFWGIVRRRSYLRLALPQSPWLYGLLIHPLIFTGVMGALWKFGRSHTRLIQIPVDPNWFSYLGRFSVLYAIGFCGAHSCINFLANSGHLYSTSRHVFGTPFAFVGIGVVLAALNQSALNRVTWGVGAIGVGLLAQQWVAFATDGWLG